MIDQALTVLILGATGSIGQHVVEQAVQAGHHTRALVRNRSKARGLASGAEAVIGDLTEASTLAGAVDGIDGTIPVLEPAKARKAHEAARDNLRRTSELAFGETQIRRDSLRSQLSQAEGEVARISQREGMDLALAARLSEGTMDLRVREDDLRRLRLDLEQARDGAGVELGGALAALAAFERTGRRMPPIEPPAVDGIDGARANRAKRTVNSVRAAEALAALVAAHDRRSQDYDRTVRLAATAKDLVEIVASDIGLHGVTADPVRSAARGADAVPGLKDAYAQAKRTFGEARADAEGKAARCKDLLDDVRRYAGHEQFQRMEPTMSRHIAASDYEAAFEASAQFLAMTLDRIACIRDDLANLDKAVETAVSIMAPFVSDALRVLKMAQEFRIPDTSPVLPGMQVMQCRQAIFSVTEAMRRQDIAKQLVAMAASRTVPQDGSTLLAELCTSIAGGRIGISLLKINTVDSGEHQAYDRLMHSGGQFMATSMMVFALIASLRARMAGNHRSNRAATIIMDNPFGKLSYDEFWRTVLSALKVLGVQVIAYTGKADMVTALLPNCLLLQRSRNVGNTLVTITPRSVVWEAEAA
jgi:hypothetical protein